VVTGLRGVLPHQRVLVGESGMAEVGARVEGMVAGVQKGGVAVPRAAAAAKRSISRQHSV
jgi:hypothetical protein